MTIAEAVDLPADPMVASKDRLTKNIAALASSQMLTWLLTSAAMLIVPRALGPSQMGTFSAATSVTAILALVGGFVTADFLVREMVVRKEAAATIAGTAFVVRILMVPVLAAAIYVYIRAAGVSAHNAPVFYLLGVAAVASIFTDPLQAGF
jgi:O-antigen/teichoic acid export membrane protein